MSDYRAILAAWSRIKPHIRLTPLLQSDHLDAIAGRRVFIKAECLQHTGSFKFRGAMSALTALPEAERAKGVIAFSSGNHAQGLAWAARIFGVPAVIIMPSDAPELKINNTRAYGAEVVLYDRARENREDIGAQLASMRGLTLIRPFDNADVIAGQGTVGLELAAQMNQEGLKAPDVLVPTGGGGLLSGIALALADQSPSAKVRPAEPEGFDDFTRSLATGQISPNNRLSGSICDAIITPQPGVLTFPIAQALCGPGCVVSEEDALRAMALAFLHLKIVIEPGGAVALAAALFHASGDDPIVAVASGGNVDPQIFRRALETLT